MDPIDVVEKPNMACKRSCSISNRGIYIDGGMKNGINIMMNVSRMHFIMFSCRIRFLKYVLKVFLILK